MANNEERYWCGKAADEIEAAINSYAATDRGPRHGMTYNDGLRRAAAIARNAESEELALLQSALQRFATIAIELDEDAVAPGALEMARAGLLELRSALGVPVTPEDTTDDN